MTELPITRSVLRSELREELRHHATKADLANVKGWLVTRLAGILAAFLIVSVSVTAALLRFAPAAEAANQIIIVTATWAITVVVVIAVALRLYKLIERD